MPRASSAGAYGIRTRLTAWMIPLDARTSAVTTFDRFTNTLRPRTRICTRLPLSVLTEERLTGLLVVNLWPSIEDSRRASADPRRLAVLRDSKVAPERMKYEHHELDHYAMLAC